jgi:hypothetical protein
MKMYRFGSIGFSTVATILFCIDSSSVGAEDLKPADIQEIFVTGKPFSATPPTGKVVMITLDPDGSAKAVPKGKKKGIKGTWRLTDTGYCSTWAKGTEHCYTIRPQGDGYDVVTKSGIVIAHWTKPR